MESRYEKYMQFINSGSAIVPISYIAETLGVTYNEALYDLQEMASLGYLGTGAYINYKEQTVVLKNFASSRDSSNNYKYTYTSDTGKTSGHGTGTGAKRPRAAGTKRTGGTGTKRNYNQGFKSGAYDISKFSIAPKIDKNAAKRRIFSVFGIILLIAGISTAAEAFDMALYGYYWFEEIIHGMLTLGVGAMMSLFAAYDKKRLRRIERYAYFLSGRDSMSVEELANLTSTSQGRVKRDLQYMIDKKIILNPQAHFSFDGKSILLGYETAQEKPHTEVPKKPVKEETKVEDRYDAILREIRTLDEDIDDENVSARIVEIEGITRKIFDLVKEKPEKENELKSFMSYYLPTTLKLLRSYSVFEKQGVQGENIESAKNDIERILDTLVKGFQAQLDRMFREDAMDISADIEVLETMMKQDGLSGGSAFAFGEDTEKK